VNRGPRCDHRRDEAELHGARDHPGPFPPAPGELLDGDRALFRGNHLDLDLTQVAPGGKALAPGSDGRGLTAAVRLLAHRVEDVGDDATRFALRIDLAANLLGGPRQLAHRLRRDFNGRSQRHGQIGDCHVALDLRLEDEAQPASAEDRHRDQQDRDAGGDGEIAPLEKHFEGGPVDLADQPLQGSSDGALEAQPGPRHGVLAPSLPGAGVSQMGGKHEERLDQGEGQAGDHDHRDDAHHPPRRSRHEEHGDEGHDGGKNPEDHRHRDPLSAGDRPREWLGPALLLGVGVLSYHDGVVHHDSQHHDEGHQRDEIDRETQAGHHEEGAEKRERYAEAHPEGETQPQEERQHQQHQCKAIPAIAQ